MNPEVAPTVLLALYRLTNHQSVLHIQEKGDAFIIELDATEFQLIKHAMEKLIAVLEKRMIWEKIPPNEGSH